MPRHVCRRSHAPMRWLCSGAKMRQIKASLTSDKEVRRFSGHLFPGHVFPWGPTSLPSLGLLQECRCHQVDGCKRPLRVAACPVPLEGTHSSNSRCNSCHLASGRVVHQALWHVAGPSPTARLITPMTTGNGVTYVRPMQGALQATRRPRRCGPLLTASLTGCRSSVRHSRQEVRQVQFAVPSMQGVPTTPATCIQGVPLFKL